MYLVQANIAQLKAPIDHAMMADFVANIEPINALADNSPGFIWRFQEDDDSAVINRLFENDLMIFNMSVWTNRTALIDYVYKTDHVKIMRRKNEWFLPMDKMHYVLWYIEKEKLPTPHDAKTRLMHYWHHGPSPYAFTNI